MTRGDDQWTPGELQKLSPRIASGFFVNLFEGLAITGAIEDDNTSLSVKISSCKLLVELFTTHHTKIDYNAHITYISKISAAALKPTAKDTEYGIELFKIFRAIAKCDCDNLSQILVDHGKLLEIAKKWKNENDSGMKSTKLQAAMVHCFTVVQKEHKICSQQAAEILFKDDFQEKGEITIAHNYARTFSSDKSFHLWDEPFELYKSNFLSKEEYVVHFLEVSGFDLATKHKNGYSTPYFKVNAWQGGFKKIFTSPVQKKSLNPVWHLEHDKSSFVIGHNSAAILQVYDKDLVGSKFMGRIDFCPTELYCLQQAGKLKPTENITITVFLNPYREKEKAQLTEAAEVSGYLVIKLNITKK